MRCQKCGQETFLPFRCQYCGGSFCSEHRLPERHECVQIDLARSPKEEASPIPSSESYEYIVSYPRSRPSSRLLHFSGREIKHLAIAALLVIGVGLSLLELPSLFYGNYLALPIFVSIFTASFFVHEIAHKAVAQWYGLWAEFRLTLFGAMLTLLSIGLPFFKIISPGAVVVSGSADSKVMGKTSIVGPLTNIVLSTVFSLTAIFLPDYALTFSVAAFFNAWIALFNLIPFGILDGLKVFSWNKMIWALGFAASVVLMATSLGYL